MISPKPMPPAARREVASELDLASTGFVYENHRPTGRHSRASLPINPNAMRISPAREESLIGLRETPAREKRVSFHTRIFGTPSNPDTKDHRVGLDGADEDMDHVPAMSESSSGLSSENKRSSRSMSKSNFPMM